MIAGFIFLRLRGILGKKTGFEEDISTSFPHDVPIKKSEKMQDFSKFDEEAKKEFEDLGITKAHVSLSDTENYVVAFVVLET